MNPIPFALAFTVGLGDNAGTVRSLSAEVLRIDDVSIAGFATWADPAFLPPVAEMDERFERSLLGHRNGPGLLVPLSAGSAGRGLGVTVHGINASPVDVTPLTRELIDHGAATLAFVYDDNYRRLSDSAADLAGALRPLLDMRPSEPLRVWAHSMGSRIALVALSRLAQDGALEGRRVSLELVAPPLGGYASANLARFGADLLGGVKNLRPSFDMGTTSGFQRELDALSLPADLRVRVFLASNDFLVDGRDPRLWRSVARLRAEVVCLPETTHVSVVGAAANWLRSQREQGLRAPASNGLDGWIVLLADPGGDARR